MPREAETKGRGGGKATRRSARTIANVTRRAEVRARRLLRAAERRTGASTLRNPQARRQQEARREEQAGKINSKADSRARKQAFKRGHRAKGEMSPTEAGQRQFGNSAKGYHLHQRAHGLARAMTPDEFQNWQKAQSKKGKGKDRETEALLFHVATGGDLET